MDESIVIIGAGPAGAAAAVQLKRSGFDPLLIEKNEIGGLVVNANRIENYPGFPDGISGIDLVKLIQKQVERWDIRSLHAEVAKLDYNNGENDGIFRLHLISDASLPTPTSAHLTAKYLIVASGTKPHKLKIPAECEDKLFYNVRYLRNITRKKIVIVGAGDAAFDYALTLAEKNRVAILNRGKRTKALSLLRRRVEQNDNIDYRENSVISAVKPTASGLVIYTSNESLRCDYLIAAIGREPALGFISERLEGKLSELIAYKRLFIIGDAAHIECRQVGIAAGDGLTAACELMSVI